MNNDCLETSSVLRRSGNLHLHIFLFYIFILEGEAGAPEGGFYDQAYLEMGTDYGANDEISSLPTIPLPTCPSEGGKAAQGWNLSQANTQFVSMVWVGIEAISPFGWRMLFLSDPRPIIA